MHKINTHIKSLFEYMGYIVENERGNTNIKANIIDFVLCLIYASLSLYNAFVPLISNNIKLKNPSLVIVIMLNTIILFRIIIKNYLKAKDSLKQLENGMSSFILKQYYIKQMIVFTIAGISIVCLLFSFFFNLFPTIQGTIVVISLEIVGVIGVIFITLVDNVLSILENLFETKPVPFGQQSDTIVGG